ncbi:MAG: DUF4271 domain-containing protein [Mucinivorans sp.]
MEQQLLDRLHQMRLPLDSTAVHDSINRLAEPASTWIDVFSDGAWSHASVALCCLSLDLALPLSWAMASVITLLLALYCYISYRHRKSIWASIKAMTSIEDTFFIFENLSSEFKHFLSSSRLALCLVLSTIVTLLMSELTWPIGQLIVTGLVTAAIYLSIALQNLLRFAIAHFDRQSERILFLGKITLFDLATLSVVFCPAAFVVCSLADGWVWLFVLLGLLVGVHWVRLFIYFKLTGFSILQWFLYLCTLEVLPFTIIIGIGKSIGTMY